ncbi:MAG: plasmid pRiA4b ORF-3 family protein [Sulfuricaulis sp.]|uniref:plasmid pRiA4b ORF-3 family protein n=1 Tax=Sulfuricaulis sp. TaxID=2003553 RepID=UPI0034A3F5A7
MNIYQIKITLKHIRPPVWRRIQVPADTRLGRLHRILQTTMGWYDMHLHAFRVGHETYGVPDPDPLFDTEMKNERNVRLDRIAAEGDKLIYEYDFGDGWEHELLVEQVLPAGKSKYYPICLAGKRTCPPEDCGGPPGYERLLEVLNDPKHEEYEEMREWIGGDYDPEAFDLDEINSLLKRVR